MIPSFSSFSFFANAKFDWDIQHLPTESNGTRVTRIASAGYGMTAVSKAKDFGWKHVEVWKSPSAVEAFFGSELAHRAFRAARIPPVKPASFPIHVLTAVAPALP